MHHCRVRQHHNYFILEIPDFDTGNLFDHCERDEYNECTASELLGHKLYKSMVMGNTFETNISFKQTSALLKWPWRAL